MVTTSLLGLYNYNNDIFRGLQLPKDVDKEALVNNLLAECAEFEILYPDADFFAFTVEVWSKKEIAVWEKLYETTGYEYDPISNYDRHEEWEDKGDSKGNSIGKISAYNSENLVNANGAETSIENNSNRTGYIHGNIGVTTTQQMIEEERRVVKFNITDYIIDSFKRRFCLLIY